MINNNIVIDTDAYIGHFPFRKLFCNTASELAKIAFDNDIDKICVSSLEAVFYRNAMDGNLNLLEEIKNANVSAVKFLPFAIINPHYTGFEKDIESCSKLGFFGIELCPLYHNYTLGDIESQTAVQLATKYNLPIRIRAGFEDTRQRHFMDVPDDIPYQGILDLINLQSDATYILNGFNPIDFYNTNNSLENKNVYFSTWKDDIYPSINDSFSQIIKTVPRSKLVLGTNLPFAYAEPQFLRLLNAKELSDDDKTNILGGNIDKLFT